MDKPEEIAEEFNSYYSSIATKTKSRIPNTEKHFSNYLDNPVLDSIYLYETNKEEIEKLIQKLKDSKGIGPNSIPTKFLKILSPAISQIISNLINISILNGVYPDCLKIASIKPLHKKDSKLLTGNCRPISLLSNLNKIFEKVIHYRLYRFLESKKSLYKHQFGFRKKHNTNHAIIALTEEIREALDNGEFAIGVFIDLQKAFDTVEHSILLEKLSNHGIRGTANRLLTSYLNNRKHCTKINKKLSTYKECKHGVPQGSVLGPLLFLVYINDLHKSIINSKTFHFADDTSIVCRGTSLKDLKLLLQNDLFGLVHWLRANKISLNAGKTEIIIFRSRYKRIDCKLVFKMSGQKLSIKKKVKYLGIILDEHLTWSEQMIVLLSKLSRATGILAKIRHFVNFKTRLSIYYCLFESHLNYCIQCFGYLTLTNLSKLQVLQNKAMRMIFFKGPRESARPLYLQAKILPVDKLLILKKLSLCL